MKIVVIGAGPAGIISSIVLAKKGHEVFLIEKNNKIGKKLSITGKGRCNITYVGDNEFFLKNVVTNSKFLMSAINKFNNKDLLRFLDELNIKTKEERSNRVFLNSDDALELTSALEKELKRLKVKIIYNTFAKDFILNNEKNKIKEVLLISKEDNINNIECDYVILSTGGKSYPGTGSTGDGYIFAEKLGHTIIPIKPALVPFKLYEEEICKSLEGLTLKNINMEISILDKVIDSRFGELVFTKTGVSGPIVLSSSSKINKEINLENYNKQKAVKVVIDLKPALSKEELYLRITRDFVKYQNKNFENSLKDLLPKKIIDIIVEETKISKTKKVNEITKEEKQKLVQTLKGFTLFLKCLENIELGIVTSGGVSTKEINPQDMNSKIIKNLKFAGEIIDVDGYTGGFNLQIAFSTAFAAANSLGEENE